MKSILSLLFGLICTISFSQECLDAKVKLRGYFYANTSVEDTTNLGGYGGSSNSSKKLPNEIKRMVSQNAFTLLAALDTSETIGKDVQGFKVYVVNSTDSLVSLPEQDSRLYLKRQVYHNNTWRDVEYLPSSWCGNSYHNINLASESYWEFLAPCMQGKTEALFRFELELSNNKIVYSNTFRGSFNTTQLEKEQGYKSSSLMDPYDNK